MDCAIDNAMQLVSLVGYTAVWTLQNDAGGGKKKSTCAPSVAKVKSRLCIHGPSRILNGCPIIHYLLGCNQALSHGGAMHPLQIWVHLLGVKKKNVNDKRADQPAAKRAEPHRLHVLSPLNRRGWKRLFCKNVCMCKMRATLQGALYYSIIGFVVLTNALFTLMHTHIHSICTTASYMYINVRTYMHSYWKPLHSLCSWSGYWPGHNTV